MNNIDPQQAQQDPIVVKTEALTRYYEQVPAVNQLSLHLNQGQVLALLGRNGSGKTTTFKMLLGLVSPSAGKATLFGDDSRALSASTRGRIGYVSADLALYEWMTVKQCVSFHSAFYSDWDENIFQQLFGHLLIKQKAKIASLSLGETALLKFALMAATKPDLMLLDEPTLGLDAVIQERLMEHLLWRVREHNTAVIISSHQMAGLERIADKLAILKQGELRCFCDIDTFQEHVSCWYVPSQLTEEEVQTIPGLIHHKPVVDGTQLLLTAELDDPEAYLIKHFNPRVEQLPLSFKDTVAEYISA